MKKVDLPFAELVTIAATRGFLGVGLALLFGDRLDRHQRRIFGGLLTVIGVFTSFPLIYDVLRRRLH